MKMTRIYPVVRAESRTMKVLRMIMMKEKPLVDELRTKTKLVAARSSKWQLGNLAHVTL